MLVTAYDAYSVVICGHTITRQVCSVLLAVRTTLLAAVPLTRCRNRKCTRKEKSSAVDLQRIYKIPNCKKK